MNSFIKLLILLLLSIVTCSAKYMFGCQIFSETNLRVYDYKLHVLYSNSTLKAAKFTDADKLSSVFERIGIIMKEILSKNLFNTIDSIHRFWAAYYRLVENGRYSGAEFFSLHQPAVPPNSGSVGLLVNILKTFTTEFKEYEYNVYLASVYSKASDAFYKTMQQLPELPPNFQIKAVAGVLKFTLETKLGYILIAIDPEDGTASHVVIMDDEIHSKKISGKMRFRKFNSRFPHLIHSSKMIPSTASVDNNHYFYNVEKPFCSIPTVTREELLISRRFLIKRDKRGNPISSIHFDMIPFLLNPVFYVIFDKNSINQTIPFDIFNSRMTEEAQHDKVLISVAESMGLEKSELHMKLNLLNMFRDSNFLLFYSRLINDKHENQNYHTGVSSSKMVKKRKKTDTNETDMNKKTKEFFV